MTNTMMIEIEQRVIEVAIDGLLAAGYEISVDNGEEIVIRRSTDKAAIVAQMKQTDEEHLITHRDGKRCGFVFLVYGNSGYDVINDYSVSLESALTAANQIADHYAR